MRAGADRGSRRLSTWAAHDVGLAVAGCVSCDRTADCAVVLPQASGWSPGDETSQRPVGAGVAVTVAYVAFRPPFSGRLGWPRVRRLCGCLTGRSVISLTPRQAVGALPRLTVRSCAASPLLIDSSPPHLSSRSAHSSASSRSCSSPPSVSGRSFGYTLASAAHRPITRFGPPYPGARLKTGCPRSLARSIHSRAMHGPGASPAARTAPSRSRHTYRRDG